MINKKLKQKYIFPYNSSEEIIQNLKDAGCNEKIITYCLSCLDLQKKTELLKYLENHRKELLDKVHEGEKQINSLDYLVFQIERQLF